ncbi:MAG: hypothetical protein NC412_09430 [Roseburia sp.]|nr:hypothetical protein [Roseburia sp.]MCM1278942.1 hypothetical protein [Robinsoniella sp.]
MQLKKVFKSKAILFLISVLLLGGMTLQVHAGTITASGVSVVTVETNYKYYATGYTTSPTRHYTSVHLINNALGAICAESGRKWGTGKVENSTPIISTVFPCTNYSGRVYYGFEN